MRYYWIDKIRKEKERRWDDFLGVPGLGSDKGNLFRQNLSVRQKHRAKMEMFYTLNKNRDPKRKNIKFTP